MPRVMVRKTFVAFALAALFSSCQMEMGIGAKLNRDGSGTFTMAIAVDKEFVDGLAEANRQSGGATGISGIKGFEDFFNSLEAKGWRVRQTKTPAGDQAFSGQCDFRNVAGFDGCVRDVGSAEGGSSGLNFGGTGLTFDFGTTSGFFKTRAFFAGAANLSGPGGEQGRELTRSIQSLADQFFSFEIRAELPGSVRIVSGGGSVRDGVAVWKPRVGEKLEFRAESDAINPVSLVVIALPVLALLGIGAWGLMRRRPSAETGFVAPGEDGFAEPDGLPGAATEDEARTLEHDTPS